MLQCGRWEPLIVNNLDVGSLELEYQLPQDRKGQKVGFIHRILKQLGILLTFHTNQDLQLKADFTNEIESDQ